MALRCNSSFPKPVFHRQSDLQLRNPGQQPAPLRRSGRDSCPDLRHLPYRLPKREGPHPPESPSAHVSFGWKERMWKDIHGDISKNSTFIVFWEVAAASASGEWAPSVCASDRGAGDPRCQGRAEVQFCTIQPKSLADLRCCVQHLKKSLMHLSPRN